ncbi:hypothetical protein BDY24DRAFT_247621 [Mrakia frigida]|uniref:uncharacterized protein n=1 Tax=Mrakia frigida TaxID=29902 RepID=UPI003FCC086A
MTSTLSRSSSHSSNMPLLLTSLPSELLTKILLLLPLKSLLSISSTCTLFRSLFLDSAVLQYSFLLQFTHMKDADPTAMSALERYNELKERDQRWRSMTWKKRQAVVSSDQGTLYDLLGGVLALGLQAPCTTLEFSRLPTTRGTSTDVPTAQFTPGFTIKDFTMDPSQDLLVLIETISPPRVAGRPVRRHSYKIHLYTLSTFQPHPLAKEQILTWPYWVSNQRSSPFISIQDDMVALHANAAEETKTEGGVAIWDWKRGVLVALPPPQRSSNPSLSSHQLFSWLPFSTSTRKRLS